jgi:large subunit ribosomal protein L21
MSDPIDPTTDPESDEAPESAAPTAEVSAEPVTAEAAETESDVPVEVAAAEEVRPRRTPRGPRPYAVIETGGKQYRVRVGDSISVEKLDGDAGNDVTIDRVLLLGGTGPVRIGTPLVEGATVSARIDEQYRGEKIVIFKYKPKKHYRKRMGHRQSLTRLAITAINA